MSGRPAGNDSAGVGGDGRRDHDLGRVEQEVAGVEGGVVGVEAKAVAYRLPGLVDGQGERGGPGDVDRALGGDDEPGVRFQYGEVGGTVPVEVGPLSIVAGLGSMRTWEDRHTWVGASRGSTYNSP